MQRTAFDANLFAYVGIRPRFTGHISQAGSLYCRNLAFIDRDWIFAVNKYHEDLHMRIAECARSSLLKSRIENNHVLIFNWLFDITRGQQALPANFHRDLITSIVSGNPQEAEEAMRGHVIYGLTSIQRTIEPLRGESWRSSTGRNPGV